MINHPYILLKTKTDLSDNDTMSWLKAVTKCGPNVIVVGTQINEGQKPISFYKKLIEGEYVFVAALARNLREDESNAIVENFNQSFPDGDFEVAYSQEPKPSNKHVEAQDNILKSIALEAAKRCHNNWLSQRITEGWKFGQKYNSHQKSSPAVRDWENLAESYRKAEYQRMVKLLEVLDEMKLKLVHR